MPPKSLCILGVTGSIGESTADVILNDPDRFDVKSVSAHRNFELLAQRARDLGADKAVIADEALYSDLKASLSGTDIEAMAGERALCEIASDEGLDLTIAAIVGAAGLRPLMASIEKGIDVAIANKEPLVAAGSLVMRAAEKSGSHILPIDSEHNAIFQVYDSAQIEHIERIILTASGGPFRTWDAERIKTATPEQACAHPNWSMGAKISVDSATMMNKALEVIEAHHLFPLAEESVPGDKIDVIVHPQSTVHSMVEYNDGSILAQLGASDMRTPIAYALAWPQRMDTPGKRLDFKTLSTLEFEQPDYDKFPALPLAHEALKAGQGACLALNAYNEVAVAAFLEKSISFGDISKICTQALQQDLQTQINTLEDVLELDQYCRTQAEAYIKSL